MWNGFTWLGMGPVTVLVNTFPLALCFLKLFLLHKMGNNTGYQLLLNLNSVNQLIFVMVKCGVLFEVRTKFLYNI
jgi:hypothetical protein